MTSKVRRDTSEITTLHIVKRWFKMSKWKQRGLKRNCQYWRKSRGLKLLISKLWEFPDSSKRESTKKLAVQFERKEKDAPRFVSFPWQDVWPSRKSTVKGLTSAILKESGSSSNRFFPCCFLLPLPVSPPPWSLSSLRSVYSSLTVFIRRATSSTDCQYWRFQRDCYRTAAII